VATAQQTLFDTMLSHMDANGDREISRDEFVTAVGLDIADRPGFDAAVGAAARSLIQVADVDASGALDPGEYTRLAAVYGAGAEEAGRAFGRLDQDRNGVLDAAELTMAIGQFFASRDPGVRGNVAFGRLLPRRWAPWRSSSLTAQNGSSGPTAASDWWPPASRPVTAKCG
jgi:hypothetical protein